MDLNLLQKKKNNKGFIVKSNYFVEASYRLNVQELRMTYLLTTKIEYDDEDFKPYKFSRSEVTNILKKHKYTVEEFKSIIASLKTKELTIIKEKSILTTSWLSSAEYFDDGTVELCFDKKLKPYLLQLKSDFTKLDVEKTIQFKSAYSIRMYELLKQYKIIGERFLRLDEMRYMLQIGENEYKQYGDFKKKVINQAIKEINKTSDIFIKSEDKKQGRKVYAVLFKITPNESKGKTEDKNVNEGDSNKNNINSKEKESEANINEEVAATLFMDDNEIMNSTRLLLGLDAKEKDILNIVKAAKGDYNLIQKAYEYTIKMSGVENVPAYMIDAIKNGYANEVKKYYKKEKNKKKNEVDIPKDIIKDCSNCAIYKNDKCILLKKLDNGNCYFWEYKTA